MRFRSNIILNIPQYYFHMAAILKNGCHFFPAEYRQGSPPRSCAGRSPEHIDTQHVFTAAHVRWTPKTGFCSLGIREIFSFSSLKNYALALMSLLFHNSRLTHLRRFHMFPACLIKSLSWKPFQNLFRKRQLMSPHLLTCKISFQ